LKILQTVKYYHPSKGGMETVVKNIVEGVTSISADAQFTIYSNHNTPSLSRKTDVCGNAHVIREATPLLFKSQPLNFRYGGLSTLIRANDIIHHHYPFPNMEMALLRNKSSLKRKKFIVTWHANIENSRWKFTDKYYKPLINEILKVSKHIVVTSPQLFESSKILQTWETKVHVIPLSHDIDMSLNPISCKSLVDNNIRKVLFVGKLRSYKGVKYLIDAISKTDYELIIVGEGEEETSLKNQAISLNVTDRVKFFKDIDNTALRNIYHTSDLFVLPSINEAEAFGVVQLEAMAFGLPVINTYLNSGVPSVSLNNVTGKTVAPRNADELYLAIKAILSNPELYARYSLNSINRAKKFTREKLAESYLNLYNS
jgi:glycosyltransferase involved in cell wall biosynthesis